MQLQCPLRANSGLMYRNNKYRYSITSSVVVRRRCMSPASGGSRRYSIQILAVAPWRNVRFGSKADIGSFEHLICTQQKLFRDRQTQRFGGGQIDNQIKLGWLLDRQVSRFSATQDFVDILGSAPE